jgi:periplasmic protein TonB
MPHVDILDQPESLGGPLARSLVLHVSVFAGMVLVSWLEAHNVVSWGDRNPGGGSPMVVNVVGQIPLPSRGGTVNPVANDTHSEVPEPKPEKVAKSIVKEPEPDAIPIKSRAAPKKPSRKEASINKYRAKQEDRPNQLYSREGQALVSPMVGIAGSGGVGVGRGSPFGEQFGGYVDILRQRVAQKWRTSDVDPRIRSAPPAIVTFTIRRDGSIAGVRLVQTSGNLALDLSAQRAIADAAPFPPLPIGYGKNDVSIEFWFELKR